MIYFFPECHSRREPFLLEVHTKRYTSQVYHLNVHVTEYFHTFCSHCYFAKYEKQNENRSTSLVHFLYCPIWWMRKRKSYLIIFLLWYRPFASFNFRFLRINNMNVLRQPNDRKLMGKVFLGSIFFLIHFLFRFYFFIVYSFLLRVERKFPEINICSDLCCVLFSHVRTS